MKKFLFFLLIILLGFSPIIFQGEVLFFGDNYSLMVPGKMFTAQWLSEGVFPLWNPHILSGLPWIGDINQSVLYPFGIIFLFLKPGAALNLTVILHLFLTMWGMYELSYFWMKSQKKNLEEVDHSLCNFHHVSLVAAVLWVLSSQILGSVNNLTTIQSLAWMPWVVVKGLQIFQKNNKNILFFSIVVLLQFLGGYPQHVMYSILTSVVLSFFSQRYFFSKKIKNVSIFLFDWFKRWAKVAVVTGVVTAVAWLPFLDVLLKSTRISQSSNQALVGSLQPALFVKMLLPHFFDHASAGMKWGPVWNGQQNFLFYVTWLGLFILISSFFTRVIARTKTTTTTDLFKKQVYFFSGITLFTLIFSLGGNLPGFNFIQESIVFFKITRYPSMMLIITNLVLALWVGVSLYTVKIQGKMYQKWMGFFLFIALFAGFMLVLGKTTFSEIWDTGNQLLGKKLELSQFHTLQKDKIIFEVIFKNILVNSLLTLGGLFFLFRKKMNWVVVIFILDLLFNGRSMFFFAPQNIYDSKDRQDFLSVSKESLPEDFDPQNYRFLTRNANSPYTDYGTYWEAMAVRQPFSDSFVDEKELNQYQVLKNLKNGYTPDWNGVYGVSVPNGYTTLLPQDYADLWQGEHAPTETRINSLHFISLQNPLLKTWSTRYYLVDTWFEVQEDLSNLRLVTQKDHWQLYELPDTLSRFRYEDDSSIDISDSEKFSENPNQIFLQLKNEKPHSNLIIADRYDENWQAWINGNKVAVENQDGMRKIPLQEGQNSIELRYVPKMFYLGLLISSLSLLFYAPAIFRKLIELKR